MDFFALIAPVYDRLIPVADLDFLRQHLKLPCNGLLVDLGGGTGRISTHFLQDVRGVAVVDRSWAMVRRVQRRRQVWPVVADAAHLPFRCGTFACALVVDAFHHFARQEQVLAEVGQVLEPAGRLVIEEPDIDKLPVKCIAVGERLLGMRSHFRSAAELARLVATRFPHVHVEQGGRFAMWIVGERADSRFVQACQPPGRRLSSEATVADEAGSEKKSPSLRKSWPAKGA